MKTKCVLVGCCLLFSIAFGSISAADAGSADEQTVRDLDDQWSAAASAKDLEKTVSFYSDDAMVMPPNAAAATTKEAVRKLWQDLFAVPGVAINWHATKVEVAKSGDVAYTTGTYQFTMNDATGKPVNDTGKYVAIWKKQTDGKWKCSADIWNSDMPAASAAAAEKK